MNFIDHVTEYAAELRGNWKTFDSFYWSDKPEDAAEWCIVYTHNRDSDALARSNATIIRQRLEACPHYDENARNEHHGHWACGWVDGYAIRVSNAKGEYTGVFKEWCDIQNDIAQYPFLDESHFSDLEFTEACAYWAQMSVEERVRIWQEMPKDFHLMACRRDELPDSHSGYLNEYLRGN